MCWRLGASRRRVLRPTSQPTRQSAAAISVGIETGRAVDKPLDRSNKGRIMDLLDPFFLEALVNGILLGGVFALPALGLNLVFGVVDVVWLCYAELVMAGMYAVWFLATQAGWPLPLAFAACLPFVALLGLALHWLVVRPLLNAPPINQVLATGGVLFVLQGAATLLFSTEFRSLGVDMPPMEVGEVFVSGTKLAAFCAALLGAGVLWAFLKFTYVGTAIRAIARDREVMP